jgi:hypothetical protein
MAKGLLSASFLLALPLAACAPMPTPGPPPATYLCVAEPASWAIGKAVTDDVVERIRVDTNSRTARVLRPGQVITMEFSAERVNVKANERNAIIGISCG